MVKMGTVWDRTTAFFSDRLAALMPIVVLLIFLPAIAQSILQPVLQGAGSGAELLLGIVVLALSLAMVVGQLGILAMVIDRGIDTRPAMAIGLRRLLPAIGVGLLMGLAFVALALPIVIAFVVSGVHWVAVEPGRWVPAAPLPGGLKTFVGVYGIVVFIAAIWLAARMVLLNAVVVGERRGVGAIARAFRLTRGLALKIVGVMILLFVVWIVCSMAATTVLGSAFQLLFGGDGAISLATILTAIVSGVVMTGFTVLATVFVGELYLAARATRDLPVEAE